LKPLGVGLPYFEDQPPELYRAVDFVEITPESLCRERRGGALELLPEKLARARETCGALPIVVHGVELSIGSAHSWNGCYIDLLDRFQAQWRFEWHSEHLAYQTIPGSDAHSIDTGVPLPLPPTREAAELVASRSSAIERRYGVPFLLENPAHYLAGLPSDPEIGDDAGLMNAILDGCGCGNCSTCTMSGATRSTITTIPMRRSIASGWIASSRFMSRAARGPRGTGPTRTTAACRNRSGICSHTRCRARRTCAAWCSNCSSSMRSVSGPNSWPRKSRGQARYGGAPV
jgi:hypothetical protein